MEENEFCNLGSINVEKIYDESKSDKINWGLFQVIIEDSIRFLDNIISINNYVFEEFKEKVTGNRKIGLGVAGFANLLIKLGIRYDSEECLNFIDKLFMFKHNVEQKYNTRLGKEKGNFPNWHESIYGKNNIPARCCSISTQAPSGSISSILNTTAYGIEPLFAIAYKRRIITGEIHEANELFKEMLHEEINDEAKERRIIIECYDEGTTQNKLVPKKLRDLFRCANDISPEWHVKVQARIQKYYDNAISKTINAPESDTKENLYDLIMQAWESGVKGLTYYRNNSRQNQTMQIGANKTQEHNIKLDSIQPISRSTIGKTYGSTDKYTTACGSFYLTINRDKSGNIIESFVNVSKNGTCKSNIDGLNRLLSLCLRSGVKIEEIVDQLRGITCPACTRVKSKGEKVIDGLSCPDIIAKALGEEHSYKLSYKAVNENKINTVESNQNLCPECGSKMNLAEGCSSCSNPDCGYSHCE